ncbi:sulfatase family protein [Gayadomonas joobiniege]|uniref:sulfatase family protein n=1 Tax=Gayadomonas joobiniege TaxID=1234606 RepID=UPI0003600D1A|nr:arylsulfatase [Gayadomonas joobiniege]
MSLCIRRTLFTSLLLVPLIAQASFLTDAQKTPNFVYILFDDMGLGDISAYNPEHISVSTPNIDALANGGMMFTNAHTSSAVCSPTRYGLMMGEHPARVGLADRVQKSHGDVWIQRTQKTIANVLQDAGYITGYAGKWHLGYNVYDVSGQPITTSAHLRQNEPDWSKGIVDGPFHRGFDWAFGHTASADIAPYKYFLNDRWLNLNSVYKTKKDGPGRPGYMDPDWDFFQIQRKIQQGAVEFITDVVPKNKPFFLYVPLSAPHNPVVPHPDFQGKTLTPYTDYIKESDAIVGAIVAALKEQGYFDNTLIIITSDNGGLTKNNKGSKHISTGVLKQATIKGQKTTSFEGGHRVPFIAHWGNGKKSGSVIQPGTLTNDLVNLQDFYRTAAAIVGQPLANEQGVDSWNILPILLGDGTPKRLREANVSTSYTGQYIIAKQYSNGDEYKLIFGTGTGGWGNAGVAVDPDQEFEKLQLNKLQLFKLDTDLSEQYNLAADGLTPREEKIVRDLHQLLREYIRSGRSNMRDPDYVSLL